MEFPDISFKSAHFNGRFYSGNGSWIYSLLQLPNADRWILQLNDFGVLKRNQIDQKVGIFRVPKAEEVSIVVVGVVGLCLSARGSAGWRAGKSVAQKSSVYLMARNHAILSSTVDLLPRCIPGVGLHLYLP